MIELEGHAGGGQLLRTALALSLSTGKGFSMSGIRAGRANPGLLRQHLTAVEAAVAVGDALVEGATPGSTMLRFIPRGIRGGDHRWSIGTAGSTTLVLQTVLPALWMHGVDARLTIEGGTHNPQAPSADFIAEAFLPLLAQMGLDGEFAVNQHGFYPAGGGNIMFELRASARPSGLRLHERGAIVDRHATAILSAVPAGVARRELDVTRQRLGLAETETSIRQVVPAQGPGNALHIRYRGEHSTAVFTGFGMKRVTAERVAEVASGAANVWLKAGVAVDEHLADQLLLPIALAGEGSFSTTQPSDHTRTNAALIERFLPVAFDFLDEGRGRWTVAMSTRVGMT